MILFYAYIDRRASVIRNRKIYFGLALIGLLFAMPLTAVGISKAESLWSIAWAFPLLFLILSVSTFFPVKRDHQDSWSERKNQHLFRVENARLYQGGREIKQLFKIRLYEYPDFLLMKTPRSFFRIPNDQYLIGSRTELLQTMVVNDDHTVWLRLPIKTDQEKTDALFEQIDLARKRRLFYSEHKDHIVYIYQREDGFFSVGAERLVLADEVESAFSKAYGWWEPENIGCSIFETEEMAYNDIKNLIAHYKERTIS